MTAATAAAAGRASRLAVRSVLAIEQSEGEGARVRRSIGTASLRNFTPFLMLDHFKISEGAGFPTHMHRGMTTLTYMLEGESLHEDFKGNKGKLGPGDLQFMIAGKGILHAEMPVHVPGGPDPIGLQLWVDIPKQHKLVEPSYQELKADQIPDAYSDSGKVHIKTICGEADDETEGTISSPVRSLGGCWFLDVSIKSGGSVFQRLPKGWNSFLYILEGSVTVGPVEKPIAAYHTVVLTNDDDQEGVELRATNGDARVVVVSGEPLDQDVVQHGPVVMTTVQEVREAFMDYQFARNGFEGAHDWVSTIDRHVHSLAHRFNARADRR